MFHLQVTLLFLIVLMIQKLNHALDYQAQISTELILQVGQCHAVVNLNINW